MRVDKGQTICLCVHKAVFFLTLPINSRSSLLEAKTYNEKYIHHGMGAKLAKDLVVLVELCSIATKEQDWLEYNPDLWVTPMLAQDVSWIVLSIEE